MTDTLKIGRAEQKIWHAVLFASINVLFSFVGVLFQIAENSWINLIDVAFMACFTYGIYRKSRICTLFTIVHFLLDKALFFEEVGGGKPVILVMVLFGFFFVRGLFGSIQYHRLKSLRLNVRNAIFRNSLSLLYGALFLLATLSVATLTKGLDWVTHLEGQALQLVALTPFFLGLALSYMELLPFSANKPFATEKL